MAKQIINVGLTANDKSGDPLRTAFTKVNDNFTELYARAENTDSQTLSLVGNTLSISGGNSVDLSKYVDSSSNTNILSTVSIGVSTVGYINTVSLSAIFDAAWPDGSYTVNFGSDGVVQIQITSNIASVYSVTPGTSNTWSIGDLVGTISGTASLNGGADIVITVATITPAPVALDLTKSVQKLTDGVYTLGNGEEGQIMYFVQQTGATGLARVYVTNACRINGAEYTNNFIEPFINNINNVVTMIYTDNAWQSLGGQWD